MSEKIRTADDLIEWLLKNYFDFTADEWDVFYDHITVANRRFFKPDEVEQNGGYQRSESDWTTSMRSNFHAAVFSVYLGRHSEEGRNIRRSLDRSVERILVEMWIKYQDKLASEEPDYMKPFFTKESITKLLRDLGYTGKTETSSEEGRQQPENERQD